MIPFVLSAASAQATTTAQKWMGQAFKVGIGPKSADVVINLENVAKGRRSKTRYDVSLFPPSGAAVQIEEPTQNGVAASKRRYILNGGDFLAYDFNSKETIRRKIDAGGALADRLSSALGPYDDSLRLIVDPTRLASFFADLGKSKDWKTSSPKGLHVISRRQGPNFMTVAFDATTGQLRKVSFGSNVQAVNCQYEYRKAGLALNFTPPAGSHDVTAFFSAPALPRFANKTAETTLVGTLQAYRRLKAGRIVIDDSGKKTQIAFGGNRFMQSGPSASWAYDAKSLTIFDAKRNVVMRGASTRNRVLATVASVGLSVDPVARMLLAQAPPFADLFSPSMTVTTAGSIEMGPKKFVVLKAVQPRLRLSMLVRTDTHFIESLTSEVVDDKGAVLSSTTRRFSYESIGEPPKSVDIPTPASAKSLTLPRQ